MSGEFVKEAKRRAAAEKARNMRYKCPMLASLGWSEIQFELNDIEEACGAVHYFVDDENDSLVAALDGDEDEAFEFRMTFSDVEGKCELLRRAIDEIDTGDDSFEDYFNMCTVALIGNRYDVLGYDGYQEDYMSLCRYEANLAVTEAGKRLMRMTKQEIIASIGQCVGILFAFFDLRLQYQTIEASMAVLREENMSVLKTVKEIEAAYERASDNHGEDDEFNRLLKELPERIWLE